jgi:hypothetical protein
VTAPEKLYVVVDETLPPGQQLAQAVHAAFQLSVDWPDRVRDWWITSNYLVVLSCPDPIAERTRVHQAGMTVQGQPEVTRCSSVYEPDLPGDPCTAVAFCPADHVGRALSSLRLALKEVVMA